MRPRPQRPAGSQPAVGWGLQPGSHGVGDTDTVDCGGERAQNGLPSIPLSPLDAFRAPALSLSHPAPPLGPAREAAPSSRMKPRPWGQAAEFWCCQCVRALLSVTWGKCSTLSAGSCSPARTMCDNTCTVPSRGRDLRARAVPHHLPDLFPSHL